MDLKNLRIEKGYSLQQVADGTGLPKTSLFHWESGTRQPAADVLPKLAEFYGITTDALLGYKAPNLPAALEEPEEVFEKEELTTWGGYTRHLSTDLLTVENSINKDLKDVTKTFFKIGYKLDLISRYRLYNPLGYESIIDYAEDKFGFSKSTTYNFMKVYEMANKCGEPLKMDEKYLPYDQSKLIELSRSRWADDTLLKIVKPTDTVKEIQAYVSLWNKSYAKKGTMPKGDTVKEALAIAEEEKAKKALPQPTAIPDDIPPGQMSIFDEEESERPFDEPEDEPQEEKSDFVKMFKETEDEFGGAEFVQGGGIDDDNISEEQKKEYAAPTIEIVSDKLTLKNDNERKEFLKKAENFNIPVLRNEELGLEITKRVLRNGATIYRTTYTNWAYGYKEPTRAVSLCLVDPQEEIVYNWSSTPQRPYLSYTLSGTAETYIVQYLSKHKDEI